MSEGPLVSICIPVYNGRDFVGEAIESALQQTYANVEILVADNCSTDDTRAILHEYAGRDERLSIIHNDANLGMVGNWNKLLFLARGKYIKILCADDLLEPDCIETFVTYAERMPEVALLTSDYVSFGDYERRSERPEQLREGRVEGPVAQRHLLAGGNFIGGPSAAFFRKATLHIGVFNPAWQYIIPDYEMWLRLLSQGDLYVVPRILSRYRVHENQLSQASNRNFCFWREHLNLLDFVFRHPQIYGTCTRSEKRRTIKRRIRRYLKDVAAQEGLVGCLRILPYCLHFSAPYSLASFLQNLPRMLRTSGRRALGRGQSA